MIKHAPSECGEFETGCHTQDANNMALMVSCNNDYHDLMRDEVIPEWKRAMQQAQSKTLATAREELEMISLGWLLATQAEFYKDVAWAAAEGVTSDTDEEARKEVEGKFKQLTETDRYTIRDWFCWLHRHLVHETKELKRWNER